MADHLPLRAFERKAHAAVATIRKNTQHVRAMFWAWSIRYFFKAGETKQKPDDRFLFKCTQHQPAVMHGRDQNVYGNHVDIGAGPDESLELLNEGHFLRGFKDANSEIGHG